MSEDSTIQILPKLALAARSSRLVRRGLEEAISLASSSGINQADPLSKTRALAESGDSYAQFELGEAYHKGVGVAQNYTEALRWYLKAAEQSHLYAMENLGDMFESGQGVLPDPREAYSWYHKATDIAYADFWSKDPKWDYAEGFPAAWQTAEYGYPLAQWVRGSLLACGVYQEPDYVQGYMWLSLAAAGSSGDDQKRFSFDRDAVAAKMTSQDLAEARRLAQQWKSKMSPAQNPGAPSD